MLLMSAVIGMNRISHSKMVVSIASVAGSIKGARIARKVGKKNHAQKAVIILIATSIRNKIPATKVKVRAVFVLIFYDSPSQNLEAVVLPERAYCFGAKKLYKFYSTELMMVPSFLPMSSGSGVPIKKIK